MRYISADGECGLIPAVRWQVQISLYPVAWVQISLFLVLGEAVMDIGSALKLEGNNAMTSLQGGPSSRRLEVRAGNMS